MCNTAQSEKVRWVEVLTWCEWIVYMLHILVIKRYRTWTETKIHYDKSIRLLLIQIYRKVGHMTFIHHGLPLVVINMCLCGRIKNNHLTYILFTGRRYSANKPANTAASHSLPLRRERAVFAGKVQINQLSKMSLRRIGPSMLACTYSTLSLSKLANTPSGKNLMAFDENSLEIIQYVKNTFNTFKWRVMVEHFTRLCMSYDC